VGFKSAAVPAEMVHEVIDAVEGANGVVAPAFLLWDRLRVGGIAAPFESSALPVSSLNEPYRPFNLNPPAQLPPDLTVEVPESSTESGE
jgi:hypothetical protein